MNTFPNYCFRTTYQGKHECEENTTICGIRVNYQNLNNDTTDLAGNLLRFGWDNVAVNGLSFKCCPTGTTYQDISRRNISLAI